VNVISQFHLYFHSQFSYEHLTAKQVYILNNNELKPLTRDEIFLNRFMRRADDYRSTVKIELQKTYEYLQCKRKFQSEYPFANKDDWTMLKEDESFVIRILVFFMLIGILIFMPFAVLLDYKNHLKLIRDLELGVIEYKSRYLNGEHYS
jgi:hypothetical protein